MNNKFILLTGGVVIIGGIALLMTANKSFIEEVTQEVVIYKSEKTMPLSIGTEAPNFELSDINGNKVKRSDFLGKPLVVMFWTTWNEASADQVEIIDGYLSKGNGNLFKLITINSQENPSMVSSFISRGGYKIDILLDENGEIGEAYEIKTLPTFYFIDREGIIRNLHIGPLSQDEIIAEAESVLR